MPPSLVLLHGYPLDSRMWTAQAAALSNRYKVITPDFPGFGPFTMESLADGVHAMLQKAGALPCVLGGLSMGGYVAMAYARKYMNSLRGLMLVDTRSDADSAQGREGRLKMIALAQSGGAAAVAQAMLPRLLAEGTLKNRPQVVKELREMIEAQTPLVLEQGQQAMLTRQDQTAWLASVTVPTLVVVGDADVISPPAGAQAMAAAIPGAQLVIIRGAGHMSPMEQPNQVTAAMDRFLRHLP